MKTPSLRYIKTVWKTYNQEMFDGRLKEPEFWVDELGEALGYFHPERNVMELCCSLLDGRRPLADLHDTILHEMVHQVQALEGRQMWHDEFFFQQGRKVGLRLPGS